MDKEMKEYIDSNSLSIWDILFLTLIVSLIGGCIGSYIYLFTAM